MFLIESHYGETYLQNGMAACTPKGMQCKIIISVFFVVAIYSIYTIFNSTEIVDVCQYAVICQCCTYKLANTRRYLLQQKQQQQQRC